MPLGHGLFGNVSETCRSAMVPDGGNPKHTCHALSCIPAAVSEKANVEVGPARERRQPKIDLTPHESLWFYVGRAGELVASLFGGRVTGGLADYCYCHC